MFLPTRKKFLAFQSWETIDFTDAKRWEIKIMLKSEKYCRANKNLRARGFLFSKEK